MKRITVAGLRKLAEKKGLTIRHFPITGSWQALDGTGALIFTAEHRTTRFNRGLSEAKSLAALHAALSTLPGRLPDKPNDKKRGEK
jgi:hypothetical protein